MTEKTPDGTEFRTGKMTRKVGDYPKGCKLTTDPECALIADRKRGGAVFVDRKRFETWEAAGWIETAEAVTEEAEA